MSASAHKIYGIKGIGLLVKKENIDLIPLIHGGKSTTKYRSGTPPLALIASFSKALRLATSDILDKYKYVEEINKILQEGLKKYEGVYINNNKYTIPYILNISVMFMKPETLLHALEEYDIYISTQSACTTNDISASVLALTNDIERAKHSARISLSNLTSKEDIKYFLECFDKIYHKYKNIKN
jgi:cysteine desulfurase